MHTADHRLFGSTKCGATNSLRLANVSSPLPENHESYACASLPGKKDFLSVYVPRPPCEQGEAGGCVGLPAP
jgi:glycerol-3-phosphate acyltransferase PlsY